MFSDVRATRDDTCIDMEECFGVRVFTQFEPDIVFECVASYVIDGWWEAGLVVEGLEASEGVGPF